MEMPAGECTDEAIDRVHVQYMAAVVDIFERNKKRFGYPEEEKLVFVSATE